MSDPPNIAVQAAGNASSANSSSKALRQFATRFGHIADARVSFVDVAQPTTAEELAAKVREARQRQLAVLTVYNSSNVGASLSGEGDCLVLDLSKLNRILDVNPDYAFARVEPGVSFAELSRYLTERNLPLMVDAERDPDASIAGSIFAKGMGFTPYADHVLVQCGAEFVLPTGELMRTGMGALPDSRTWQLYKFSLGPFSDGVAIQSADLIPAQVGIWLMGKVPATQAFAFELDGEDALANALEVLRPLKLNNMLPGTISLTHRLFDAARSTAASQRGEWRLFGALYGMPSTIPLMMPAVDAGLREIPGCRKLDPALLGNDPVWQEQLALMNGTPTSTAPRFRESIGPAAARLTFVAPIEGEAGRSMMQVSRPVLANHNLPLLTELAVGGRSLFQTIYLPYEPSGASTFENVASCARQLIADMGRAGFGLASESVELSRLASRALGDSPLSQLQARVLAATG